jgi:type VI secretion system secreted protein Hcp
MAQTVHLAATINGSAIEGESSIVSMERENTIECASFQFEVLTPREAATGQVTGTRQYKPLRITKRIDKTSPLLFKALTMSEPVNEGVFRFYRVAEGRTRGGGRERRAEEHFMTITIANGYVASMKQTSEGVVTAGPQAPPMMEEVEFVFQDITMTYESNGATHTDPRSGE